jgi:hypothetical protein
MITLSLGVTGSSKTYNQMPIISHKLEWTDDLVVTNIQELELGEWQKHLDARAITHKTRWKHDINRRVFIIPRPETSNYYRFRGVKTYEKFKAIKGESIEALDTRLEAYFAQMAGDNVSVTYVMDELHRHFRSERWDEIGDAVMFHIAQHRHLNDEFFGIAQNGEQIAARFNRQVHECYVWRNHYKEQFKLWGLRMGKPGGFKYRAYYFVPKSTDKDPVPFDEGTRYLDKNVWGKLYRTRGALGGMAVGAETERKRFKLPFWSIILIALGFFALMTAAVSQFPKLAGWGMKKIFGGTKQAVEASGLAGTNEKKNVTEPPGVPRTEYIPQPNHQADPVPEPKQRKILSLVVSPQHGRFSLYLSDGTVINEEDGMIEKFTRTSVRLKTGETLYYTPARSSLKHTAEPFLPSLQPATIKSGMAPTGPAPGP